jgi:hypothetical protein
MMIKRLVAAAALGAGVYLAQGIGAGGLPVSNRQTLADPPCAAFDTCKYMPNPYNGGQLQPTWELPGGYGLPGGSPTVCDPQAYRCFPATPGSGF